MFKEISYALNKGKPAKHPVNAQVNNSSESSVKNTTIQQTSSGTQEKEHQADYEGTKENKDGSSEY